VWFERLRKEAYRRFREIESREHSLLYLFFELTRRCNLRCRHCGSDCAVDPSMREMSAATWLSIADYVAAAFNPTPTIVITGGEPTVRPDLVQIVSGIRDRGLSWGMVTNGIALDRALMASLEAAGLMSVTLSFDGGRDAVNWLRNRADAYEAICRAADLIGASRVPIRDAVTCVFRRNEGELEATAEALLARGFTSWRLFRIFPKGRAASEGELSLDAHSVRALVEWIKDARPRYAKRGFDVSYSCEGYFPFAEDAQIRAEPFFCRSGINFASILSDGTITGCNNNDPAFACGNVATDDFATAWRDGFRALREREAFRVGPCAECREWAYCSGGAMHLRKPGDAGPGFCLLAAERGHGA
jgi:radical SAM protein with 4Fe4S-binding SPASM domain